MNSSVLLVLILAAVIILAILAFDIYQENKYRKKIRQQFGHADGDALMESNVSEVRDAEGSTLNPQTYKKKQVNQDDEVNNQANEANEPNEAVQENDILSEEEGETEVFQFEEVSLKPMEQTSPKATQSLLMDLKDLSVLDLPWFNRHFDYLAYISLREPQELKSLPRLGAGRRVTIAGCTTDGQFKLAEPVPNEYYQAFVIGLQAIGRMPLAGTEELETFGENVNEFAKQINGGLLLTKVSDFLRLARPLDEICARVDQIIAIHLLSRTSISGTDLRSAAEGLGFYLSHDGAFYYSKQHDLFPLVTMEETPFTATLLSQKSYKGFSMLFDITKVPVNDVKDRNFDRFMDLAVKLSSALSLDLVDDQLKELSTNSLRSIGDYIKERQKQMKEIGIKPGSELAKRIFS